MLLLRIPLESKCPWSTQPAIFPLNNLLSYDKKEKAMHLAFNNAYTLLSALDSQVA